MEQGYNNFIISRQIIVGEIPKLNLHINIGEYFVKKTNISLWDIISFL